MQGHEYQKKAKTTAHYPKDQALYYLTVGLAGEAGEVANKIKKIYRDDNGQLTPERIKEIKGELGGTLWYIAMLCEELGLNLDEVMEYNNQQLASRQERGTISGDGDNR